MENIEALKGSFDTFLSEIENIKKISVMADLGNAERKAVSILQLMEVQVAYAGNDLRNIVLEQSRAIRAGEVKVEEVKTTKKTTKKTAKKAK